MRRPGSAAAPTPYPGFEQEYAVVCSESPNPRRPRAYQTLEVLSYARAGDMGRWCVWDYEPCATRPARAANPYVGPWDRPTANPILVINPTFDPVTSYHGAEAMVRELADPRLLTLEGYGHTALLNPSACINEHASRYLIEGTLPPVGAGHLPARHTALHHLPTLTEGRRPHCGIEERAARGLPMTCGCCIRKRGARRQPRLVGRRRSTVTGGSHA